MNYDDWDYDLDLTPKHDGRSDDYDDWDYDLVHRWETDSRWPYQTSIPALMSLLPGFGASPLPSGYRLRLPRVIAPDRISKNSLTTQKVIPSLGQAVLRTNTVGR